MNNNSSNQLVRQSRAGDEFHYVWAARQCLRLLNFNTTLTELSIEGASKNADDSSIKAGELVIDVAEYHRHQETNELSQVVYYQLKHSTVREDQHFIPSELEKTLSGFAERFRKLSDKYGESFVEEKLRFSFISNRLVDAKIKQSFQSLQQKTATPSGTIEKKLLRYTELTFEQLQLFASCVTFNDSEGNYLTQRDQLRSQIHLLLAGDTTTELLDSLVAMVKDKALPHSSRQPTIRREDVLFRLGISSLDEIFPAPPKFEIHLNPIVREQQAVFLSAILESELPVVIHAPGGVGKSVLANSLCNSLPAGSLGIVFDCFAAGTYRNPSSPRHQHKQALVQIVNEIAIEGLCEQLLPSASATYDRYIRLFRTRIQQAVVNLRKIEPTACLVIFIDAADNAEIAANEMSEMCFAHQLMRERPPESVRIVALCRTERKKWLKLDEGDYVDLGLQVFSEFETKTVLEAKLSGGLADIDIKEFHRLSGGNPRIQANALDQAMTMCQALEYLGPYTTNIDEQIGNQLDNAIKKIKKNSPDINVEQLCFGLAALPPFIPLEILAAVAGVSTEAIQSFASDMGRPLWIVEQSLQFRDEPTETWFKQKFEATQVQLDTFIDGLKLLTRQYAYAAEALPSLLLKAQHYNELVIMSSSI